MTEEVRLLGIVGGSGSGKTTLAARLAGRLGEERAAVLCFDVYYRDLSHLPLAERHQVNFDHPDTLDAPLFVSHLDALLDGLPVEVPMYDYATHSRSPRGESVHPRPVVIVEGILLMAFDAIVERLDNTVFLDCPEAVRLERRLARDVAERGRTPEHVERQFSQHVAPMHERFVQPAAEQVDLLIPHHRSLDAAVDEILGAFPV